MFFKNKLTTTVKKSFHRVKTDFNALRYNTHEWVVYLNRSNEELLKRVELLEGKVKKLEAQKLIRIE